jgi:3-oxoacyl-[acyl-carrier protein] reductase
MDLGLADKRALVTGSSAGIGEAIAHTLAQEGAIVAVHGRDPTRAENVCGAIEADGGRAVPIIADLAVAGGPERLAADAVRDLGGIDILINNAGAYANRTWSEATPAHWEALYRANVVSAVALIRQLAPAMRERTWGRVIQISSGEATNPFPTMPDYSATKAALVNLTVSLSKHLTQSGVTANTISPGIILTPGVEAFYRRVANKRGWGESWEEIEKGVLREFLDNPCGRLGRVEEVAALVAYIASPRADYINGANLRIDGGSTATIN